jgi:hypothetical protein
VNHNEKDGAAIFLGGLMTLFFGGVLLGMGICIYRLGYDYAIASQPAPATSVIQVPVMYLPNGVTHVTGNWFLITDPSTGKWLEMVTSTLPTSSPEVTTVQAMQQEIYGLQQENAGLERVITYYTSTSTDTESSGMVHYCHGVLIGGQLCSGTITDSQSAPL